MKAGRLHVLALICLFFPQPFSIHPGIEGGFDVEQDHYEEDVKVVILPDRQEVTSEELPSMPDVVRERVRASFFASSKYHVNAS